MPNHSCTNFSSQSDEGDVGWLDLSQLVRLEATSEAPTHPVMAALSHNSGRGWRAQVPGYQTIRLAFTSPQSVHRILLEFREGQT